MPIIVERPKNARGKRAKHFVARTSDSTDAVEICRGDIDQTAAEVRTMAVERLALAAEKRVMHVRAVAPGWDGAACDVWILHGDPIFGFRYGRVYAHGEALGNGKGCPTFYSSTHFDACDEQHALTSMLTHMADTYDSALWDQFLWGLTDLALQAIRREITARDAARARMG